MRHKIGGKSEGRQIEMQRQCTPFWEPDGSALCCVSGSRFSGNTGFDGNGCQICPKQLPVSAPLPGFLSSFTPPWFHPPGPFSKCNGVVPPHSSFASCVHGQCGTKGDALTLCRSLQAYASLCARAGQTPLWRNSTFCRE